MVKRDVDSERGVSRRRRSGENNEGLRECSVGEGRASGVDPDKRLSLILFVSVKGCDSVTFAGSGPAPSFLLIMQEPIRSRLTPVSAGSD